MIIGRLLPIGFLVVVVGCPVIDPSAHKRVILEFPSPGRATPLSATDTEVQAALRLIDEVFVANGFVRDRGPPTPQDQATGIIVTYGGYPVLIRGRQLVVNFVEFGKRRTSPIVDQMCSSLRDQLSHRFGDQRVKLEIGTSEIGVR